MQKILLVWNIVLTAVLIAVFAGSCTLGSSDWVSEVNRNKAAIREMGDIVNQHSEDIRTSREYIQENRDLIKNLADEEQITREALQTTANWLESDLDEYIKATIEVYVREVVTEIILKMVLP